jgi:nickel transport protein
MRIDVSFLRMLLLCAALGAMAGPSRAHRVNVFALVERDSIHAEAYFKDGSTCRNSVILLISSNGDTLASARTDGQGQATVPLQALAHGPRADLRVVLIASLGHRAEYRLAAEEIWPAEAAADSPSPSSAQGSELPSAGHDNAADTALQDELARQLAPLARAVRDLQRQQERASVRDVLGGIGYIMGLMGLYYFLRGRCK